jgi:putative flippase GtrA
MTSGNRLGALLDQALLGQFLRFSGVGVVGTAVHYLVLIVLVSGLGLGAVPASVLGFSMGALVNYALNYHFTFRSQKAHRNAAPRFFLVAGVGLLLTAAIMELAAERIGLHYLLSQVVATGCVLLWTFSCNRWWTFREKGS